MSIVDEARSFDRTLHRVPRRNGLHAIHRPSTPADGELTSHRLVLDPEQTVPLRFADQESALVLQQGAALVRVGGGSRELGRKSVFDERASAVFLPADQVLEVTCLEPLEAVVVSARARAGGTPLVIEPDRVSVVERGHGGYAREVHNILVDAPGPQRLVVGETFNPPGNWSSFPPHKHDGANGEPALEEVYHFRIDPPQGFALQMLYTAAGEERAHVVRDGDAVRIPYGYHPVAAAPGYRLYYLWALAGQQRGLALHEDPDHGWMD